jgi:integrase
MRRSEVAKMKWAQVDEKRATCYVPASGAKNRQARVVPLNADALAVLKDWNKPRGKVDVFGPHPVHVFYFRRRAPIKQVTTAAWRTAAAAAGLPSGFSFHKLRHTWASWQVQSGTPLKIVMEMGGWNSYEMVLRYAHLAPGHLAQYADRALIVERGAQKVAQSEEVDSKDFSKSLIIWWKGRDSNPRPRHYECRALTS